MIDFAAVLEALHILGSSYEPWLYLVPGLLLGLIVGAIPGLSVTIGMALVLPLTVYMDFLSALIFLTAIFTGGGFGCAIPAILINVPGSSTAVATTFDGYPMTRSGRASEALGLALAASVTGTFVSYVVLFLVINIMSGLVLRLGPLEMFLVAIWGLTLIAMLSGGRMAKGLLAGILGILLGTVGMNALGTMRGTIGSFYLLDGIPTIPAMMALFAAPQMLALAAHRDPQDVNSRQELGVAGIFKGIRDTYRHPIVLIRGAFVGTIIGAVPGVGASIANLVSYSEARRRADRPEDFGKGEPRGVVASEAANSSSEGGAIGTLLTLGLPGGGATAIMLAAFSIHNITGGPRFVSENTGIVYAIIFANLVQAIALLALGLLVVRVASAVVRVPVRYIVPSVFMMTVIGSYAYTGNMAGPVAMLVFSVLGWGMHRYGYPVAAIVVGLLLGSMVENELVRTLQISGGELSYFLNRPVSAVLLCLLIMSLFGRHLVGGMKRLTGGSGARTRPGPPGQS